MVNELQSQEWAYLLDPCFQLVNTNGKPLTNGHIEVFYHGTRTPYYCASDWNGTLHPFKIKIDSLGSNVVLADPNYSYDVYVYNAYDVLQMSRYNVNPGVGGSGGSSSSDGEAPHWNSDPNGGASSSVTGGTTVYLTLPSSEDQPEFVDHTTDTAIFLKEGLYHIDAVVSFKQDDDDLQNIIKDLVVNTGLIGWDAQMTGQKNWTGPESTDDDRHFLELHTVVSVPEDLLQPLYFQISSPVDLDSAAIEKLDIVKLTAGGGGMTYAAGYGIDITNRVISVSGMMPEASAANFVDNSTYQVDIQNIYETIAETSAMIPSGVATEQYVQDYTSAFITEDALDGYATEQWVVDQGYITSADLPQSVPLVAGEGISIVDTSASTIISCSGAGVSEEWVENYTSAFITASVLDDYVTENDFNDAVSGLSDDISAVSAAIPSLDGYATQQWVEDQNFITSADIPPIPQDVVTSGELATVSGDIVSQIPSLDGYATQEWVEDYVSGFGPAGTDFSAVVVNYSTLEPPVQIDGLIFNQAANEVYGDTNKDGQPDILIGNLVPPVSGATPGQVLAYEGSGQIEWTDPPQTAVSIEPTLSSGTKIAEFNINGTSGELFAPSGSSAGSDVFYATYGTTTFDEIWNALDAGKTVFLYEKPSGYSESYMLPLTKAFRSNDAYSSYAYFAQPADPDPYTNYLTAYKVYKVNGNNSWYMDWVYPFSNPSSSDANKVLTCVGAGQVEWQTPASGSTYTAGDNISIVNDEISVSGTAGLIAGDNISITASGDSYIISSSGSGGGASYTAGAGISIDGNGAISVVTDNTTVMVYRPQEVYATKDSFYGTMSFSDEQLGSATSNSTCTFNYGLNANGEPFKISCSSDQIGCEIRVEMGNDQYFTKSVISTVSMARSNWTGMLVTLTDTETILDGYGLTFYYAWGSPTYRFSNSFDWTDYTFDEIFENSAIYVRLRAWDSTNGVVVGDPLGNPISSGMISYVSANMSLNSDGVPQQIGVVNPLPDYSYEDAGKVLQVQNDGLIAWSQAGGGSEVDIIPSLSSGTKIADYVIGGTSGVLYAPDGGSYNGVYPIQVSSNSISLDHDSSLTSEQTSAVEASAAYDDNEGEVVFMPGSNEQSESDPCQIQGNTTVTVYGSTGNTVRMRLYVPDEDKYIDMKEDLVDANGDPIHLAGGSDVIPIRTNESTWGDLFDFSSYTISDLWNHNPAYGRVRIELWEYSNNAPLWNMSPSWPEGLTIDFNSMSSMFGVTNPLPASTSAENGKVLTVVSGAPAWADAQGGGSVTFPLEVSGSTNVYEARDGLTSGYVNAGEIYVGYHDDGGGGEPDIDTVSITPYMVQVKGDWGGISPTMTEVSPGVVTLYDNEGGSQYVDFYKVENWDNTYDAVNSSATYWNSSIFSNQITSAALVNSLPADASAHPNYLYLIPET